MHCYLRLPFCLNKYISGSPNPVVSMEIEECGEEESGHEDDAMSVISIDDVLNASSFIELLIK